MISFILDEDVLSVCWQKSWKKVEIGENEILFVFFDF